MFLPGGGGGSGGSGKRSNGRQQSKTNKTKASNACITTAATIGAFEDWSTQSGDKLNQLHHGSSYSSYCVQKQETKTTMAASAGLPPSSSSELNFEFGASSCCSSTFAAAPANSKNSRNKKNLTTNTSDAPIPVSADKQQQKKLVQRIFKNAGCAGKKLQERMLPARLNQLQQHCSKNETSTGCMRGSNITSSLATQSTSFSVEDVGDDNAAATVRNSVVVPLAPSCPLKRCLLDVKEQTSCRNLLVKQLSSLSLHAGSSDNKRVPFKDDEMAAGIRKQQAQPHSAEFLSSSFSIEEEEGTNSAQVEQTELEKEPNPQEMDCSEELRKDEPLIKKEGEEELRSRDSVADVQLSEVPPTTD